MDFFEALRYLAFGQGIKMLKRRVQVRILHIRYDMAYQHMFRKIFNSFDRLESLRSVIPEGLPHNRYFEFEISTWSSNVDGMLTLN